LFGAKKIGYGGQGKEEKKVSRVNNRKKVKGGHLRAGKSSNTKKAPRRVRKKTLGGSKYKQENSEKNRVQVRPEGGDFQKKKRFVAQVRGECKKPREGEEKKKKRRGKGHKTYPALKGRCS